MCINMPLSISILFSFLIPYFWYCSVFSWCCVSSWSSVWRRTGSSLQRTQCRSGTSLDVVALGVCVVLCGINWEKSGAWRGSQGCGRKKSRVFAQTMCHTGCHLLFGSFQRRAPCATSCPCGCRNQSWTGGKWPGLGLSWGDLKEFCRDSNACCGIQLRVPMSDCIVKPKRMIDEIEGCKYKPSLSEEAYFWSKWQLRKMAASLSREERGRWGEAEWAIQV